MAEEAQRVELDVSEQLKKLFGDTQVIIKTVYPGQRICRACQGTGVYIHDWTSRELQRLMDCPGCYTGVVNVCKHCDAGIPKTRTQCECDAARREREAEASAKEEARRETCKRIALADYGEDMLFDDTDDRYISTDCADDPSHVYFACVPTKTILTLDADDFIERLNDAGYDEIEDYDIREHMDVDAAKADLQPLLDAWLEKHLKPSSNLFFRDNSTIVVVPDTGEENADV